MTKAERKTLLRARFAAKCRARRWIDRPVNKRPAPPPRRPKNRDHLGPVIITSGQTCHWVLTPDPQTGKVDLSLARSEAEPSPLTKIAQKIYEWNRWEWCKKPNAKTRRKIHVSEGEKTFPNLV